MFRLEKLLALCQKNPAPFFIQFQLKKSKLPEREWFSPYTNHKALETVPFQLAKIWSNAEDLQKSAWQIH